MLISMLNSYKKSSYTIWANNWLQCKNTGIVRFNKYISNWGGLYRWSIHHVKMRIMCRKWECGATICWNNLVLSLRLLKRSKIVLNKLKKENMQFVNKWEEKRKKGFFKYVSSHIISLGIMMFFIYCIDFLISKKKNFIMVAIIYATLVIIMSIFSWMVNEFRYQRYRNNKRQEEDIHKKHT